MCACVHAHAGDRGQASREASCSGVDSTLPVRNPGEPSSTSAVVLKPRLIVQYYLGGTLVALEISRLNIFSSSLSCDSPLSKRIEKGECILLCILKRMICVRLHMEDGTVSLASTPTPRKKS